MSQPVAADSFSALPKGQKLTDAQVLEIRRERIEKKTPYTELAARYGVRPKSLRRVCTGQDRGKVGGPVEPLRDDTRYERCQCGGYVVMPCRLCALREKLTYENWAGFLVRELLTILDGSAFGHAAA